MGWGEMFPKQNANFVPNPIGFEGNNLEVPMQGLSTNSSPGLQGEYQSMPHPANGDQRSLASGS
ncbi:hypothetical protein PHISCL_11200 [Aspergillus sclerotialis]|uniref:Uncharacterized protein n=1 Tax=Aspergillus sclerotialis TaxID=2070753 RepID=A0A3A2Z2N0_9EURO|nr:hypothetical protein PHISCL_11200 [Aspergillus sclerotialis]